MGWRQRYKRGEYPWYVGIGQIWNGRRQGRFWKRCLSKARRKWRDNHHRGLLHYESTCNWKGW